MAHSSLSSPAPAPAPARARRRLSGQVLGPLLVLAMLAAALHVAQRQLADYSWSHLGRDLAGIGSGHLVLAGLATVLSYLLMTGYDALALRYVEHPLPYRRYAAASFLATAFGNSLGASAVVGAALRARVYSAWGLPAFAITRVAVFNMVTIGLGAAALGGLGLAVAGDRLGVLVGLPDGAARGLALSLFALVAGYLLWAGHDRPALGVRQWRIDRPTRRLAVGQLALSTVEWLTMAAVLYALLPAGHGLGFASFAVVFVLATMVGLVSNVPGGLGVMESVLLIALSPTLPPTVLAPVLVAYRLLYYLAPLTLAAGLLAVLEFRRGRTVASPRPGPPTQPVDLAQQVGGLTPSALALVVAVLGAVLVLTGELPGGGAPPGLAALPASLAGIGLLLIARGLHRRLRGAWLLAILTLAVLILSHRTLPPTLAAAGTVALLVLARGAFHRTTSVFADPRGWTWPVATLGLVGVLAWWHGTWAGRPVADSTWWATSLAGDTPAALRLGLALGAVGMVVAGGRLQSPETGAATASPADLDRAGPILATAGRADACLVWTGDKRVMFSPDGGALLMYQIEGRSWVAMGDPVGRPEEFGTLLERFLDECDRACGRPVLYCVREDLADLYRHHGLVLAKLGEEATVPLPDFSMEGKRRAKLRSEIRASLKAGVEVEVVAPEGVPALLSELGEVSARWLAERRAREKTFSLGAFDPGYLVRFPVAVARIEGRVVAFASLWATGARQEVKVDLMRRVPDAPRTVMSHLFVESMQWGRAEGYTVFSLGMAPLSGLRTDGAATFWDRVGHLLWTHGEHFYNFQGLRQFKERFDPEWQTRYVASQGGPALPAIMLNVATLVGGGWRGLVSR